MSYELVYRLRVTCVQVIRRLRERGEPVRLFGETDYDAFQRLRKIEILAPEVNKVRHQALTLSARPAGPDSVRCS